MKASNLRWMLFALALAIVLAALITFRFLEGQRAVEAEAEAQRTSDQVRQSAGAKPEQPAAAPHAAAVEPGPLRVEVAGRTLTIHVVDPEGAPVIDARLALFRAEELFQLAATDAKGCARFDAGEGSAGYAIDAVGFALACGDVELGPGERTISLVEGDIFGGTVLVDGLPPDPPLELEFVPKDRNQDLAVLPKAVAEPMRAARGKRLGSRMRTRADGAFELRGLAHAAAGTILWSGPYFVDDATGREHLKRVEVAAPRRDLLLRLTSGLQMRLRVVDSNGAPIPGASVAMNQRDAQDGGWSRITTTADSEGRYTRDVLLEPNVTLDIEVAMAGGAGARKHEVVLPAARRGILDLGDLATEELRKIEVLVQDDAALAVAGAKVAPLPWRMEPDERTDDAGKITCWIGANDRELAATALGFLPGRATVPAGASTAIVTLAKATLLEFEIVGVGAADLGFSLAISGPEKFFVGQGGDGPAVPQVESTSTSMTVGPEGTTFETQPEKDGHWRILGVATGQDLRAVLSGSDGSSLWSGEIAPLAAGEHRVVTMQIAVLSHALRVRVLKPDGTPASEAEVAAGNGQGSGETSTADARGEAVLHSVYIERCTLEARLRGFPGKSVVVHGKPSETVEIVLEAPRSIEVELVAKDGSVWQDQLSVQADGQSGAAIAPGRYRIDCLPPTEVMIRVRSKTVSLGQLHDARIGFARIVVGEPGIIRATIPPQASDSDWSIALAERDGHDKARSRLYFETTGAASASFAGLAFASYELWLERRSDDDPRSWSRVGSPTRVELDAEHPLGQVELRP